MRELSIITGMNGNIPIWHKHSGFVDPSRITPAALAILAGWPADVEVCVADSAILWDEDQDTTIETDGDYESIGETHLLPKEGETWVFVLGERLYMN